MLRNGHAADPGTSCAHPLQNRWGPRRAAVALLGALLACGGARAQAPAAQAPPPLIALHYQDLLATEPAFIDLFIPPPPFEEWDDVSYQADDCLLGDGVLAGPPGKVLIVRFDVPGNGSCISRVELTFSNGHDRWPASALVVVNRLPDLLPFVDYVPRFRSTSVVMPQAAFGDRMPSLLQVGIDNPGAEPLLIHGLGNDAAFGDHIGQAFRYDPAQFHGLYSELLQYGSPFQPTLLQPGEEANFALVLDPDLRLPSGAGTITVRPIAILEIAGRRYSLELPRISTAWGTELP